MNVLKEIVKELKERIESRRDQVAYGRCESFEEYKYMAGEILGLSAGHDLLTDLVRKIERGEDVD